MSPEAENVIVKLLQRAGPGVKFDLPGTKLNVPVKGTLCAMTICGSRAANAARIAMAACRTNAERGKFIWPSSFLNSCGNALHLTGHAPARPAACTADSEV